MKYEGKHFRKIEIDTEKGIFLIDGEPIAQNCEWLQITFDAGVVRYEAKMFGESDFSKEYEEASNIRNLQIAEECNQIKSFVREVIGESLIGYELVKKE